MYKIMLIEDEEIIRKGMKSLLEEVIGGFSICAEASNGVEAMNLLLKIVPDIIITDIRMEKMGGMELITKIRAILPDLPIIIISGYADFDYAKKALKYNVTDYLLKPVDRVELMHVLTKITKNDERVVKELTSNESQIIRQVKSIIHQNLDTEISLRTIADQVHLNHQYLSALFKEETGVNFSKYVTDIRMEKAKELIRNTNLKIYEISSLCGYLSTKHFLGVFKHTFGTTPSDYRNS